MQISLNKVIFAFFWIDFVILQNEAVFDALSSLRQIVDSAPELKEAKNEYNRLVCNLSHPSNIDDGLRKGLLALLSGKKVSRNAEMCVGSRISTSPDLASCYVDMENGKNDGFEAFKNARPFMSAGESQRRDMQRPKITCISNPDIAKTQQLIRNMLPIYTKKPMYDTVRILSPPNNEFLYKQPPLNFLNNVQCVQSPQILCSQHAKEIYNGSKYTITVPKNTLEALKLLNKNTVNSAITKNCHNSRSTGVKLVRPNPNSTLQVVSLPPPQNCSNSNLRGSTVRYKSTVNFQCNKNMAKYRNSISLNTRTPTITKIITTKTVFSSSPPITSTIQVTKTEISTQTQPPVIYYGRPVTSTITQTVNAPPKTVNRTFIPRSTPTPKINIVELKSVFKDLICNLPRPKPWILRERPNTVVLTQTVQQPAITVTSTNLEPYFSKQQTEIGKIFSQIAHLYALIKKGLATKSQQTVVLKIEQSLQKTQEISANRTLIRERNPRSENCLYKTAKWCPAGIRVVCKTKTYVGDKELTNKECLRTSCDTSTAIKDPDDSIMSCPGSTYTRYKTRTVVGKCKKGEECETCCWKNGYNCEGAVKNNMRCPPIPDTSECKTSRGLHGENTCGNRHCEASKSFKTCPDVNADCEQSNLISNPKTCMAANAVCESINPEDDDINKKTRCCDYSEDEENLRKKFSTIVETVINNATHKFFYPESIYTVRKTQTAQISATNCSASFSCITSTNRGTIFIECPQILTSGEISKTECSSSKIISDDKKCDCDCFETNLNTLVETSSKSLNDTEERFLDEKTKDNADKSSNESLTMKSDSREMEDAFCETSILGNSIIINCTSIPKLSKGFYDEINTKIDEEYTNDDIRSIFNEVVGQNIGSSVLRTKIDDKNTFSDISTCISKTRSVKTMNSEGTDDILENISAGKTIKPSQELLSKIGDSCVDNSYASECMFNYTASLPKDEIYIQREKSSLENQDQSSTKTVKEFEDSYAEMSTGSSRKSVVNDDENGDYGYFDDEKTLNLKATSKSFFTKLSADFANTNRHSVSTFDFSLKDAKDQYCTDLSCVNLMNDALTDDYTSKQRNNEKYTVSTTCDGKHCYEIEILTKTIARKPIASSEPKNSTRTVTLDEIDFDNGETIVKTITDSEFAYLFDDNDLEPTATYFIKNPSQSDSSEKKAHSVELDKSSGDSHQKSDCDIRKDRKMRIRDLPIFHKRECPLKQDQESNAKSHECTYNPSHSEDDYVYIKRPSNNDLNQSRPNPLNDNLVGCGGLRVDDPEILLMSEILGMSK